MQVLAVLKVEKSVGSITWGLYIPMEMCGEHCRRLPYHRSYRFTCFLRAAVLTVGKTSQPHTPVAA